MDTDVETIKAAVRSTITEQARTQGLGPTRIASLVMQCEQVITRDPEGGPKFVREMIDLSRRGEQAAYSAGAEGVPWVAMRMSLEQALPVQRPTGR